MMPAAKKLNTQASNKLQPKGKLVPAKLGEGAKAKMGKLGAKPKKK